MDYQALENQFYETTDLREKIEIAYNIEGFELVIIKKQRWYNIITYSYSAFFGQFLNFFDAFYSLFGGLSKI